MPIPRVESSLERELAFQMRAEGLPTPECEYRFHPFRKWRFDFWFPIGNIAVEVEGGTWSGGRHTRGSGFEKDAEKYNAAAEMGIRVFRYTRGMIESGEASAQIKRVLRMVEMGGA